MEEKLKILLEDFRKNCKGENCDACDLGNEIVIEHRGSQHTICSLLLFIEKDLGAIDQFSKH